MKTYLLILSSFVILISSLAAQTVGQFGIPKWTSGGTQTQWVTPVNGRFFAIDGSGNVTMSAGGGGSGLDNLASSLTGETLTFTGTLTAARSITWRDLAGTVALTSDLSSYLTTSAAASAYAPLAHNQAWSTITDTPTTLAGYGISDAITAADVAAGYQPLLSALTEDVMNGTTRISHITTFAANSSSGLILLEEGPEQEADYIGFSAPDSVTSSITYVLPQSPSTSGHVLTTGAASGGSAITSWQAIVAPAGTLTGTTLASNVVSSSLTSAAGGSFGSAAFTASSAYEVPLTFGAGLTRATNTISVNASQSLSTLSNLTTNGFIKTTGGTGALSIDTATYLTTTGNGSSLTGITQSQVSGLTTTDRASFANLRPTHSTLTYAGTTDIDLDGNGFQTLTLTGNVTFTTSNRAAGRSKTIRIVGDSSLRTFTFPAGWTWIGVAAPASLAANKDAVLTITAFGTADTDVVAAYAVEP